MSVSSGGILRDAAKLVVMGGAASIAKYAIKAVLPSKLGFYEKISIWAGGIILTGLVADAAGNKVDEMINDCGEAIRKAKQA